MMNRQNRKAHLGFIFATIFIDCLGIGLLIPILPDVIRRFSTDPDFVGRYFGYFISVYALMQFFASPVLGSLSDRFGRRPVLLISLLGGALDYLLMAFAPNLGILFAGRVISGLTGASITVATAYIADVSDDSNRAANFGLIGAAFGFGFIAGPAMGGVLGSMDAHYPFIAAAILNFLNFLFGIFVLPESLAPNLRRKMELKRLNPFSSMVKVFKIPAIQIPIIIYVLLFLAGQVNPSVWTLYTQNKFQWTAFEIGWSLAVVGIMIAIVQGLLTGWAVKTFGEHKALLYAIIINAAGFLAYSLANAGWMMYAILIPSALGWISGPVLQGQISKSVGPEEQGELQGTLVGLNSLTAIFGPILYTNLFVIFSSGEKMMFPGMPFFAAAVMCMMSIVLYLASRRQKKV